VGLLIGFLRENNLSETLTSLSDETGVQVSYIPNKAEFIENIKRGAWH
jgi:LisH-like dimerisation domain